jgi:hypothetical protein
MLKLIFGHGAFWYPQLNNICNVVFDILWLMVTFGGTTIMTPLKSTHCQNIRDVKSRCNEW